MMYSCALLSLIYIREEKLLSEITLYISVAKNNPNHSFSDPREEFRSRYLVLFINYILGQAEFSQKTLFYQVLLAK